ncbi:MAG: penicillin acylase family protein [Myxococcota bacterium]
MIALVLAACRPTPEPAPGGTPIGPYEVDIRTTTYGIPHVLADDLPSASFGMGWAHARDRLCVLADQMIEVRSERAKYFGPGEADANIDTDFGWLGLGVMANAERRFDELPDYVQKSIVAYAAGYSRYLEDTPEEQIDPRCRGAAWVKPIDHVDLLAYYLHLGQLGSGSNLVREVGNAQPPGLRSAALPPPLSVLEPFRRPPIGSNGWAIGGDRTANGHGMLLSNTHFPANGELQWWESHLTVPGELDVYGASLTGSALVNVGFNRDLAWTHTVSDTPRFVVYQLTLDPADPTRYEYDGGTLDMQSTSFTIEVLQDDGQVVEQQRTLWRTRWGPMFNAPVIGWNTFNAYTWRDVNEANLEMIPAFAGMDLSTDLASFEDAHRKQGIPWVHTMMATRDGDVLYVDSAATPYLKPEAEAAYEAYLQSNSLASLFGDFGLLVFDAADPVFEWVDDPRAATPGAMPYEEAPRLQRRDFVNNSNENYWLANPLEPLTGYNWVYGSTGGPAAPRTKMNNRFLLEEGGASGADHRFDLDELEAAALSARASVAEDLRDAVVARCTGAPSVEVLLDGEAHTVDLAEACATLAAWDGRARIDSVGAYLWRETVSSELTSWADLTDAGRFYGDAFDPADPIYTPSTLAPATADGDGVLEALAVAVVRIGQAGFALDQPLGELQHQVRGDTWIPILGGNYLEGVISVATWGGGDTTLLPRYVPAPSITPSDLSEDGYYVNNGNSFVLAMSFGDDAPSARAILTYSQSDNPESPHFADQSQLYTEQALRPVLFEESEIAADPELELVHLSYP